MFTNIIPTLSSSIFLKVVFATKHMMLEYKSHNLWEFIKNDKNTFHKLISFLDEKIIIECNTIVQSVFHCTFFKIKIN